MVHARGAIPNEEGLALVSLMQSSWQICDTPQALAALVRADARPQASLALAHAALMLAFLRSPAILAPALLALVGQMLDPRRLAPAPVRVMLAYLRSPAFHALALLALVGADARKPCTRSCAGHAHISTITRNPYTGSSRACGGM